MRTGLIIFLFTALPLLTFLSLEVHARTGLLFSFYYSFIVLVSGRYFCLRGGRVGICIIFHVFHVFSFSRFLVATSATYVMFTFMLLIVIFTIYYYITLYTIFLFINYIIYV